MVRLLILTLVLTGCVDGYQLKGYDINLVAQKAVYNDWSRGIAGDASTGVTASTSFHFTKCQRCHA